MKNIDLDILFGNTENEHDVKLTPIDLLNLKAREFAETILMYVKPEANSLSFFQEEAIKLICSALNMAHHGYVVNHHSETQVPSQKDLDFFRKVFEEAQHDKDFKIFTSKNVTPPSFAVQCSERIFIPIESTERQVLEIYIGAVDLSRMRTEMKDMFDVVTMPELLAQGIVGHLWGAEVMLDAKLKAGEFRVVQSNIVFNNGEDVLHLY